MFSYTLHDKISKWGDNYLQSHPWYTFQKYLEQAFWKHYQKVQNDD
jgi:hypothetical protein